MSTTYNHWDSDLTLWTPSQYMETFFGLTLKFAYQQRNDFLTQERIEEVALSTLIHEAARWNDLPSLDDQKRTSRRYFWGYLRSRIRFDILEAARSNKRKFFQNPDLAQPLSLDVEDDEDGPGISAIQYDRPLPPGTVDRAFAHLTELEHVIVSLIYCDGLKNPDLGRLGIPLTTVQEVEPIATTKLRNALLRDLAGIEPDPAPVDRYRGPFEPAPSLVDYVERTHGYSLPDYLRASRRAFTGDVRSLIDAAKGRPKPGSRIEGTA